ncbi:AFR707Cp [Eremothecium gossypii ATCC 10895]|uniref:AFR707Cp n=1 Tax=Eremothecium gossypii (strain ATCC 10895 / CBS 109.51 / FGSC 9923 / NRRL Y-1056) TaxID=284811 RepID=Q751W8_EREGS|nr:AFR707Cp [Eremothecium gossypii ATCC 10895]AAS54079.1 AFR707Cp [Eremothecium gossypii ATCC 10895]AEY98394.1 FAFR707Cp [Eremothecium gossypii FDAG1]
MPDSAPVEPQQPAEQYPSQISCTEAFDRLTDCYSIGGLVRHYYRHGEFNGCSKEIERFKFCILHGSDPVRVQQWYREEWEMNKSTKGTSEDVWSLRR